jgi:hypothetical protein
MYMTTFLRAIQKYEGLTRNDGKGIVSVEQLAPSVERLLTAIGNAVTPKPKTV